MVSRWIVLLIVFVSPGLSGCGRQSLKEHGHAPATHGGVIVPFGQDHYHAEIVVDANGEIRIYMLGQHETVVLDVPTQRLTAYVRSPQKAQSTEVPLEPSPQPGDPQGQTSVFVGRLPAELVGFPMIVTIPEIRVDDQRYRFAFSLDEHLPEPSMPVKMLDEEERKLYLTPQGLYTEADIRANGNRTASQKYRGFRSAHDMSPQPGQKICPITNTKANSQCTWIVGGKSYEFCCPPCIDEFVKLAKQDPSQIKPPAEYIRQ